MPAIHQIISGIRRQLSAYYPDTETESFIRILFRHYCRMSPTDIYLQGNRELTGTDSHRLDTAVNELKKYRPIQYILGETEFYGLRFKVTPDVLIPRPETEELADWVIRTCRAEAADGQPRILDIGTGCGCIAITLARHLPGAEVWAADISEAALTVAAENAEINHVPLHVVRSDILSDTADKLFPDMYFDVIASNPPYITPSEKRLMQPNVLDYEPHLALFAPDDNPLAFYERIATFGLRKLNKKGWLFFEINEAYRVETAAILEQQGYTGITARKDINGKWRMVCCRKMPF